MLSKRKGNEEQFDLPVGPTKGIPKRTKAEVEQLKHKGWLHNAVIHVMDGAGWMTYREIFDEVHRLVRGEHVVRFESLKATVRNLRKVPYGKHKVIDRPIAGKRHSEFKLVLR